MKIEINLPDELDWLKNVLVVAYEQSLAYSGKAGVAVPKGGEASTDQVPRVEFALGGLCVIHDVIEGIESAYETMREEAAEERRAKRAARG